MPDGRRSLSRLWQTVRGTGSLLIGSRPILSMIVIAVAIATAALRSAGADAWWAPAAALLAFVLAGRQL